MIHNFPFFRGPFGYPRNYSNTVAYTPNYNPTIPYSPSTSSNSHHNYSNNPENISDKQNLSSIHEEDLGTTKDGIEKETNTNHDKKSKEKSSKYTSFGPIFINTDGFFNKDEPLLNLSGLKIYLDDIIILALLYILYKEDVKDDILFISLVLLLIS